MRDKTKENIPVLILLSIMLIIFFIAFLISETLLFDEDEGSPGFEETVEIQQNNDTMDLKLEGGRMLEAEAEDIRNAMDIGQSRTDYSVSEVGRACCPYCRAAE